MSQDSPEFALGPFAFHLRESTARALLRDPELPARPTFEEMRAALLRLDAQEKQEAEARKPEPATRDQRIKEAIRVLRVEGYLPTPETKS